MQCGVQVLYKNSRVSDSMAISLIILMLLHLITTPPFPHIEELGIL